VSQKETRYSMELLACPLLEDLAMQYPILTNAYWK
jgi:hypothetical protein